MWKPLMQLLYILLCLTFVVGCGDLAMVTLTSHSQQTRFTDKSSQREEHTGNTFF